MASRKSKAPPANPWPFGTAHGRLAWPMPGWTEPPCQECDCAVCNPAEPVSAIGFRMPAAEYDLEDQDEEDDDAEYRRRPGGAV